MDNDDLERLEFAMEGIRRKAKMWEDAELSRMAGALNQTTPPAFYKDVPPPGFCHPYHERAKQFIIDWLDGKSSVGGDRIVLPVVGRPTFGVFDPSAPLTISERKMITMRRQKAWATAPYVGRPFGYWWWVGIDDYGRSVGGEQTTLVHVAEEFDWW